jgi:hypothetical protein
VTSRGQTALNLVSLYRAMGGGWEMRQGQPPIPDAVRDQMRNRTNWDDMLPAGSPQNVTEAPAASTQK